MKGLAELGHELHLVVPFVHSEAMQKKMMAFCNGFAIIDCGQFHSNQVGYSPAHMVIREYLKCRLNRVRLKDYILQHKIDVVHLNSSVLAHLLPYLRRETAARICMHVRELLSDGGDPYGIGRYLLRMIKMHADQIFCISENEVEALGAGSKAAVVYNLFDFDSIAGMPSAQKPAKDAITLFMMMGQFSKAKGHAQFLFAVRQFIDRYPVMAAKCSFQLLGAPAKRSKNVRARVRRVLNGDGQSQFEKLVDTLNLRDRVELVPYQLDVTAALAKASVLVRASLSGDPWGRDIIEGMAYGKAIVATGTYAKFAQPGVNAILVPPGDPGLLSEAFAELAGHPDMIKRYGKRSAELARSLFDYRAGAKRVSCAYRALLARGDGRQHVELLQT